MTVPYEHRTRRTISACPARRTISACPSLTYVFMLLAVAGKLDFGEFCQFVRDREEGEFTEEELKKRFDALDGDKSGKVDMAEYLLWSLKDALARSSSRVVDLFRAWDEDGGGTIDKKEFHKAIRALGFEVEKDQTDAVFESLDDDNSGKLEYKELAEMLRKGAGADAVKRNLKRMQGKGPDHGRGAKLTNKNLNKNYQGSRTATLPDTVKLEATSDKSIQTQLAEALNAAGAKLIDLFREWDDDGNGALDKKELRQAVAALGYDAPKKDVDALFDSIDKDSSGWIEYEEVKKALSTKGLAEAEKAKKEADKAKTEADAKKAKAAAAKAKASGGMGGVADGEVVEGDVAGTGEEDFETGMRQNLMERDAADADQDGTTLSENRTRAKSIGSASPGSLRRCSGRGAGPRPATPARGAPPAAASAASTPPRRPRTAARSAPVRSRSPLRYPFRSYVRRKSC